MFIYLFFLVALIGRVLFLIIKKRNPWKYICLVLLIFIIGIPFLFYDYHLTASGAISKNIEIIRSEHTTYGKAVLFKDNVNHSFGLAQIHRDFGFLYKNQGSTTHSGGERNEPFISAGIEADADERFLVGIRTYDPNIKYIVVGNHFENLTESDTYTFTKETVEHDPDHYHIKEVDDTYAFFVFDAYSAFTWTIRALDKDGNLVADKLHETGSARYIEW